MKTKEFEGRDLKSLLNSSCVLDFANNTFTKVEDALTYIFNTWKNFTDYGFTTIEFSTDIDIDIDNNTIPTEKKAYNVLDILKKYMQLLFIIYR